MPCDLCSSDDLAGSKRVSCSRFRRAVKAGLRPPSEVVSLGAALGLPPEEMEAVWVHTAMADSSDWKLCAQCARLNDAYLWPPPAIDWNLCLRVLIAHAPATIAGFLLVVSFWVSEELSHVPGNPVAANRLRVDAAWIFGLGLLIAVAIFRPRKFGKLKDDVLQLALSAGFLGLIAGFVGGVALAYKLKSGSPDDFRSVRTGAALVYAAAVALGCLVAGGIQRFRRAG